MKSALLLLTLSMPAAAAPRLVPLRDVTVVYDVAPRDHAPLQVQVEIAAGGDRLRITSAELPTSFLIDRPSGTATILLPMLRLYATAGIAKYDLQRNVLQQARFARHATHRQAGLVCTEWTADSPRGHAEACITDDGVILSGTAADAHGPVGSVRAVSVRPAPLPSDLFDRPADFRNAGTLPVDGFTR